MSTGFGQQKTGFAIFIWSKNWIYFFFNFFVLVLSAKHEQPFFMFFAIAAIFGFEKCDQNI